MRVAVVADVHANEPALVAVLEAIEQLRVDRTVCLGDLVGYNAQPHESLRRIRGTVDVVVAGNHDVDLARPDPVAGTSGLARRVQEWTREQLDGDAIGYLSSLPHVVVEASRFVAVHGCFLNPRHYTGYVTPTMLEANLRAIAERPEWPCLALCGHTHVPLCGWLEDGTCTERALGGIVRWPSTAEAVLFNPGSVGQPRDGDPRAAFILLDLHERYAELRRVRYDVEAAVRAIAAAGLPYELGERLREGR